MTNKSTKLNICVITHSFVDPVGASATILSNFIDILEPLSNELFVITGKFPDRSNKRVHIIRMKKDDKEESALIRAIKQLKITYNLFKISKEVDVVITHIGAKAYILPVLTSKFFRKRTILIATGSVKQGAKAKVVYSSKLSVDIFYRILVLLEKINYTLSDRIIVYSERLVEDWDLQKHRNKILVTREHFLDFDKFKIQRQLSEREHLVGYIGRLSSEKGIRNFVQAISKILKKGGEIKFVIGGDGDIFNEIKEFMDKNKLSGKVKLLGWVPNDELSEYLNELKLLVLPSYVEGLPNIMLEGMACGTPVLATPVGAIPDIIKDGETGFIMENNSPECITNNVIRALNSPNLDEIVKNARNLIEEEYTYEAAVERYKKILEQIESKE